MKKKISPKKSLKTSKPKAARRTSKKGPSPTKPASGNNNGVSIDPRFIEDLKRQWMATVDALVDPLMIVSTTYKIDKVNKAMADLAGGRLKDLIGKKCFKVFANRSSPCPGCQMPLAGKTKKPKSFSLDNVRSGQFIEVTSQPILLEDGKSEGIVQVYRDRTATRMLEAQVAQQDKLASIGLLAGGVAHEINNPLGGILVFSQMMLREMDESHTHYQDLVEIEGAAQRCKSIVDSLLDFARKRPADEKESPLGIDLKQSIQSALKLVQVHPNAKQSTIKESLQLDGALVKGDRSRITQVFVNLMQNALQAMPGGGDLTVSGRIESKGKKKIAHISISDTGVGIPPENLRRIFDPFFTTKDPGEGTGLGLAISYATVQDLGGAIKVASELNEGSTFTVSLPVSRQ